MNVIPMSEFPPLAIVENQQRRELEMREAHTEINTTLRNAQIRFILKVHALSILLLLIATVQWKLISSEVAVKIFGRRYSHLALTWVVMIFLILLTFIFFFGYIQKCSKAMAIVIMLLTAESGTLILHRPMAETTTKSMLNTTILMIVIIGVGIIISLRYQLEMEREIKFIEVWSVKFFIFSFLGQTVGLAIENPYISCSLLSTMMFFLIIFIFLCGKTMATIEFYQAEVSSVILLGMLSYYNYMTLCAITLIFFEKLQLILE